MDDNERWWHPVADVIGFVFGIVVLIGACVGFVLVVRRFVGE